MTSKRGRRSLPPEIRKNPICLKLPQWLIDWMTVQDESRALLIEKALKDTYGLKNPHLNNKK